MLTTTFSEPFFHSTSPFTTLVPSKYPVALNGHPYMLDLASGQFSHASVPLIRQQADSSSSPSEASINPEDLWRRSQDTWYKGAGQSHFDHPDSDPARHHTSKGVDVWTKWQLSLLNDVTHTYTTTATNLHLISVNGYLYVADNATLHYTTDGSTWTTVSGVSGNPILSLTSDGHYIYMTDGSDIYRFLPGDPNPGSSWNLTDVNILAFVHGRLMASTPSAIYNIIDDATSTAITTAATLSPSFQWVAFSDGPNHIYAAGFQGDKSLIVRIAIRSDGSGLDVAIPAGTLPDGEIVSSISSYLGFIVIGSNKGVRIALPDSNGDLTIGALIPTSSSVRCFEPQDRFIWFGWTDFDDVSTGLGRLDLSVFTTGSAPSYASDLMATTQGAVLDVVTFGSLRVFAVSGHGIYIESSVPVTSGTITTGQITYRLPDDKVAMFVSVRGDGLGSYSVHLSTDGGPFLLLGTHTVEDTQFTTNQSRGARFDVQLTLTAIANVSPIIRSLTLRATPAPTSIDIITAPLLLAETVETYAGEASMDVASELAAIKSLKTGRPIVPWQEGGTSYTVVLDDYDWRPTHLTNDGTAFNGTCLVKLKVMI